MKMLFLLLLSRGNVQLSQSSLWLNTWQVSWEDACNCGMTRCHVLTQNSLKMHKKHIQMHNTCIFLGTFIDFNWSKNANKCMQNRTCLIFYNAVQHGTQMWTASMDSIYCMVWTAHFLSWGQPFYQIGSEVISPMESPKTVKADSKYIQN